MIMTRRFHSKRIACNVIEIVSTARELRFDEAFSLNMLIQYTERADIDPIAMITTFTPRRQVFATRMNKA